MRALLVVAATFGLGACTSPTINVTQQKVNQLREVQTACLSGNVAQFEDGASDPARVGHYVAMSCTVETDKLVQFTIPYATATERQAFQTDAAMRATTFVMRARSQPRT